MKITLKEIKVNKSREKPLIYTQNRVHRNGSTDYINELATNFKIAISQHFLTKLNDYFMPYSM
jgi:hypothetical protein